MSSALPSQLPETKARYAISAVFLVFGTLVGSWLPHIPDVKRQIGVNDWSLGEALLCSGLGAVMSMQMLGSIVHRFGSRNVSFFGGMGACLLVPPLMLHSTLLGLCFNLFPLGLCYGCLDGAIIAHSVQVQALHNRPILAAIHGWFSFGGIVGGLCTALAFHFSIAPFPHLALTSAVLASVLIFTRSFLLPSNVDQDAEGPKFVFPHGVLLFLGFLCACAYVSEGGILDWCALYMRESLHARPEYGGIVISISSGSMALGRFVGDPLLHRFGDRRVILISGVLASLGVLAAVAVPSIWLSILSFSLACFGIANMVPVFFKQASAIPGIPTSVAVAAITTCGYGGFLIGPPLIGMVAHKISLAVAIGSLSILGATVTISSRRFSPDNEALNPNPGP